MHVTTTPEKTESLVSSTDSIVTNRWKATPSLYFMRYLRTILPLAPDLEGMGSNLRFGYLVAGHGKMREEETTYLVLICSQCATQTRHCCHILLPIKHSCAAQIGALPR